MGSRVFWAVIAGFLCGVAARSFLPIALATAFFIALIGAALLFLSYVKRNLLLAVISIFILTVAFGVVRMDVAALPVDQTLHAHLGEKVTLEGMIAAEPDVRSNGVRVALDADRFTAAPADLPVHARVLVVLPAGAAVAYGDRVRVTGTLALPDRFDTGGGRMFAYPQYLACSGITYMLNRAKVAELSRAEYSLFGVPNIVFAGVIGLKTWYVHGLEQTLPQPEAGFAAGITAGDKRGIGADLSQSFQRDSLSHVIVLSGYNINVIINAASYFLRFLPRVLFFGGNLIVIVFFVLLSGGAGSAMRAGVMALVAVLARHSSRTFLPTRALALAAFCIVLWNPWVLAFDIGFQLSGLATLGLVLFSQPIESRMGWLPAGFSVRTTIASTVATQIAVLPLLLYQNGVVSFASIPANVLALFPVPEAMFFSLVAGVGGGVFGSSAALIALPAYALLAYIISIARLIASLPFAATTIPAFSVWVLVLAYTGIFGAYAALSHTTKAAARRAAAGA